MLSVIQAQKEITNQSKIFGIEFISIDKALGRVLAEDVFADRDYPPFNRAAMDGYAFIAADLLENGVQEFSVLEEIFAGSIATKKLVSGSCFKIMTGASTPPEADAIIKIEDTVQIEDKIRFLVGTIKKGQNIAKQGEDKKQDELVLAKNTWLNPIHIASLAVVGKSRISVFKLPIVSIISTGDEIKRIDQPLENHQIRESNSYSIESFLNKFGIIVQSKCIVLDNKEMLAKAISEVIHSDIILISGGVSMGDADFVPEVLTDLGVTKIFHKVALKPGKPLWFGKSNIGVVFGLPGNPFSVQVAFKVFIEPFLLHSFGIKSTALSIKIPIAVDRTKKVAFDEYFPCVLETNNQTRVKPISINGSGDVTSVVHADGIALQESDRFSLQEGDIVSFIFW